MNTTPDSNALVRVARFKDDCAAAISFTFDDNLLDQATIAAPMLERYGFRGTFAVIAGKVPETGDNGWPRWRQLAQNGHEIANHSMSHPHLTALDDAALEREVNEAHQIIAERIGVAPVSFVYPFNARDERVRNVVFHQHLAAREQELFYGRPTFEAATANAWLDDAIRDNQWIVPMIHAIESGGFAPFSSRDVLDDHLRYLQQHEHSVWVDTFGVIASYVRQRDASTLQVEHRSNQVSFRLLCEQNPACLAPLSVQVKLPVQQAVPTATQNENPLPFQQTEAEILLQIVPSTSPIVVSWTFPN